MAIEYGIDNIKIANFGGVGSYDIPEILPELLPDCEWLGFNYANSHTKPQGKGIHFFLDDYQFLRVWRKPTKYVELLRKFACVLSPDFSLYSDYPKAMQIYNHYRKHWLAAYWQSERITVIPSIAWSDESSFEWCFDGEPTNSTVAISSVGTQQNRKAKELFLRGYSEMLKRLEPRTILFFGKVPEKCEGNIISAAAFQERFAKVN